MSASFNAYLMYVSILSINRIIYGNRALRMSQCSLRVLIKQIARQEHLLSSHRAYSNKFQITTRVISSSKKLIISLSRAIFTQSGIKELRHLLSEVISYSIVSQFSVLLGFIFPIRQIQLLISCPVICPGFLSLSSNHPSYNVWSEEKQSCIFDAISSQISLQAQWENMRLATGKGVAYCPLLFEVRRLQLKQDNDERMLSKTIEANYFNLPQGYC